MVWAALVLDFHQVGLPPSSHVLWTGLVGHSERNPSHVPAKLTPLPRLIIVVTLGIYIGAGKEIFKKRRELRQVSQNRPYTVIENPFVSCKTTEVHISSEPAKATRNDSQTSLCDDHGNRVQGYNPYTVSVGIGSAASEATHSRVARTSSGRAPHRNHVNNDSTSAAWGYTKCAMLFFVSLIITWVSRTISDVGGPVLLSNETFLTAQVPSTINRVYSLVHPEAVSFPLSYASGLVLPLQGFWNAVVYTITSLSASRALYRSLRYRQHPALGHRTSSSSTTKGILPGGGPNPLPYVLRGLSKR